MWVLYHYIGGDYRFTSYNYVTCINVMSRCVVMVVRGVMYDIKQSRATRKLSDWRGASEISAGQTGVRDLVAGGVGQESSEQTDVFCDVKEY